MEVTHMNPTQDTLDLVKGALATPDDRIGKTISASTGLLAFDLQMPAKNLYPFVTPLRNSIPRVGGGTGTATNWRQVTALLGSGFDAMGWVPEGQRSGQMSYTTASKSASFVTIGEEDAATYEAISAGRNFEDIQARMTFRLLQKMMLKEEMAILGGNASLQLGTPATPSLSASGSGATLPAATYSVIAVALTLEGYQNSSLAAGVATTKTITGADGKTYVKTMATGAAGTGTPLTSSGRGSVGEIDDMFQQMWNLYQVSPTVLYVNVQELKNITAKVLSNASGPLLRYEVSGDGANPYDLAAAGAVSFYFNPFTLNGGLKIPVRIHPRVPPGTVIGFAENLPIQYKSNEVPNVAEVKTRQDYYQIDWPVVTRQRQVGVYAEEVLAIYAPFAMGVITNIANG